MKPNAYEGAGFPLWKFRKVRSLEKSGLLYNTVSAKTWVNELFDGYYLPNFSLKGKTVLDVGACCGETAYYFLRKGASKVVCIECDASSIELLRKNVENLGMNVEVIPERFNLKHLQKQHDFMKCDIEESEQILLPVVDRLKPCVLEVHGFALKEMFEKKGFRVVHRFGGMHQHLFIMANY